MKTKELVESILREDTRAREDDRWLVYQVYRRLTKIFIPFEDFARLPSPETITRWRRYFQNTKGLYTNHRIKAKRMAEEKRYQRMFSRVRK